MNERKTGPRAYRSSARTRAAQATRGNIVEAAGALLREKGVAGFSLDAVAKQAGVTRLTVYNQFGTRRALLEAVFDDRAEKGGMHRLAAAAGMADARAALHQVIAIFCNFWSVDHALVEDLHYVGSADLDFQVSMRERNERRRKLLKVLIVRMAGRAIAHPKRLDGLVDLLFVLTGFPVYAELARDRSKNAVCDLITEVADDLVKRMLA